MIHRFGPLVGRMAQTSRLWLLHRNALSGRFFPRIRRQSTIPQSPQSKRKGIKELIKEYGYSALGIYLALSMLDLPLCYWIVHSAGKERIEIYENKVKQYFGFGKSDEEMQRMQENQKIEGASQEAAAPQDPGMGMFPWFSWTEMAIAYGIHKSLFIFIRIPLTAAMTPSIVKMFRGWGFQIGNKVPALGVPATKKHKGLWFM